MPEMTFEEASNMIDGAGKLQHIKLILDVLKENAEVMAQLVERISDLSAQVATLRSIVNSNNGYKVNIGSDSGIPWKVGDQFWNQQKYGTWTCNTMQKLDGTISMIDDALSDEHTQYVSSVET